MIVIEESKTQYEFSTVNEKFYNLLIIDGDIKTMIGRFNIQIDNNILWLCTISIFPEYRGIGLGKESISKFLEFCSSFNIDTIKLYVDFQNEKAQHIYKNAGFLFKDLHNTKELEFCYEMEYTVIKEK